MTTASEGREASQYGLTHLVALVVEPDFQKHNNGSIEWRQLSQQDWAGRHHTARAAPYRTSMCRSGKAMMDWPGSGGPL